MSRKLERYNSFIIQHIDNKTKFEEKILSTSFLFLHSLVKMLKHTSVVGYTSCGPMYIESFFTIFGQCINVLNYNKLYLPFKFDFPYKRLDLKRLCVTWGRGP